MRVLFADDDPMPRLLTKEVVISLGHEPIEAADGAQAWAVLQAERVPLAILDLEMPGLDGLELCRRLREADPSRETFVLIVTGRDADDALYRVLDAGADDFINKPVSPEQLRARVLIAERRLGQDAARRSAEAELQRARWLAGIGETTIALQHEINNPLSAIMGHVELLRMEAEDRGESSEALAVVQEAARRIAEVVRRLGDLREPRTIEYVGGTMMLDLRRADGDPPPGGSPS